MATALDLLMSAKEDVNLLSEESDICTIDAKTRTIFVPSTIVVCGVQSDKNAERIKFSCPKIVGDNLDLSKFSVRINFENVSSVDFNVSIKDQYICDDVAVDGENVTFSWLIGRNAARYMGTVRFIVCAVKTDSDSNISVEWNTTIAEVPVLEGIEIDQPQIGQEEKDVINQLLELTKNTSAEAVQNVNSAKEQAIKDIQSVSQPDTTLTIEGGLAEAKATGEAIGSLKEDLGGITETTRNIFDKSDSSNIINELYPDGNGHITSNVNTKSVLCKCDANTTYTITKKVTSVFRVADYASLPEILSNSISTPISSNGATSITFTTGNNASYLVVYLFDSISDTDFDSVLASVQIEEGTEATTYINHTSAKDVVAREMIDFVSYERNTLLPSINSNPLSKIIREAGYGGIIRKWGIIGDSLSSGEMQCYDADGNQAFLDMYQYSWGQHFARIVGADCYNFSNGGQTAYGWVKDYGTVHDESYIGGVGGGTWATAQTNLRDGYIIALGVNDLAMINRGEYPLGDTTTDINADYNLNAKTFVGYYASIIQRIKIIQPKAKFFCVTPLGTDYADMNIQIRKIVANFSNTYLIDLDVYAPKDRVIDGYMLQGHLSPLGYMYTAYMINTYIDWIIRNNATDFIDTALIGTTYKTSSN